MPWESARDSNDPDKGDHKQLLQVLTALHSGFVGERTGKNYGPITSFSNKTALVIDTLTGIGQFCLAAVAGIAVIRTYPQWGAAMSLELATINSILSETKAWVVVLAHDECIRAPNGVLHAPIALGTKNMPSLIRLFGDVIFAYKTVDAKQATYRWSNQRPDTVAKPGLLKAGDNYAQDFQLIVSAYYNILTSKGGTNA
jgi:hypothetical protein